ncbi:MAG TPA: hypothetical protein DEO36_03460 [Flavobacteriaceae bacterium]|jgi:hypothetical protein|nr:hypothetical protein [Flavobacteriaceae bacterium]
MRKITIILFGILFIFSCNNLNSNSKKTVINKEQNKDRNSTLLIFEDGVSLNIVSNFFSQKKNDSISSKTKEIKGKYLYCGKSNLNKNLFKICNKKEYEKIKKINTSHSIVIENDTLYFSGRDYLSCLQENDSILLKSTVYTFHQEKKETNLLIINNFIIMK